MVMTVCSSSVHGHCPTCLSAPAFTMAMMMFSLAMNGNSSSRRRWITWRGETLMWKYILLVLLIKFVSLLKYVSMSMKSQKKNSFLKIYGLSHILFIAKEFYMNFISPVLICSTYTYLPWAVYIYTQMHLYCLFFSHSITLSVITFLSEIDDIMGCVSYLFKNIFENHSHGQHA